MSVSSASSSGEDPLLTNVMEFVLNGIKDPQADPLAALNNPPVVGPAGMDGIVPTSLGFTPSASSSAIPSDPSSNDANGAAGANGVGAGASSSSNGNINGVGAGRVGMGKGTAGTANGVLMNGVPVVNGAHLANGGGPGRADESMSDSSSDDGRILDLWKRFSL